MYNWGEKLSPEADMRIENKIELSDKGRAS